MAVTIKIDFDGSIVSRKPASSQGGFAGCRRLNWFHRCRLMERMSDRAPAHAFAKPSRASSLELVGGTLALDLTNTSSGRGTPSHQEHLRDFDTVMQWVRHA